MGCSQWVSGQQGSSSSAAARAGCRCCTGHCRLLICSGACLQLPAADLLMLPLATLRRRFRAHLWQLAALAALGMTGSMWADTAAMATNVREGLGVCFHRDGPQCPPGQTAQDHAQGPTTSAPPACPSPLPSLVLDPQLPGAQGNSCWPHQGVRGPVRWGLLPLLPHTLCQFLRLHPASCLHTSRMLSWSHVAALRPPAIWSPPYPGSLFACIYAGVFTPDAAAFLLFLAIAPVAVGAAALPFINRLPRQAAEQSDAAGRSGLPAGESQGSFELHWDICRQLLATHKAGLASSSPFCHLPTSTCASPPSAERRFVFALAGLATLALFLVSATTVNALWPLAPSTRHLVMAAACALLLPLLALPCGAGGLLSRRPVLPAHQPASMDLGHADELGANAAPSSSSNGSRASSSASFGSLKDKGELDLEEPLLEPPGQQLLAAVADECALQAQALESPPAAAAPAPELAPLQCLCSLDFWLLFAVIAIGTGSGAHVRALCSMCHCMHSHATTCLPALHRAASTHAPCVAVATLTSP